MAFIFRFFSGILEWLGLKHKKGKILFLGLDNAGKTTLMHVLKESRVAVHQPTLQPSHEEVTVGNIRFTAFDLGGHAMARKLWKEYSVAVDAVIFIVDAAEKGRLEEAKRELDALLQDEALSKTPFLILGNKIDIPHACSEAELRKELGLLNQTTGKGKAPAGIRPMEIFMCSILNKAGFREGFQWIGQYL